MQLPLSLRTLLPPTATIVTTTTTDTTTNILISLYIYSMTNEMSRLFRRGMVRARTLISQLDNSVIVLSVEQYWTHDLYSFLISRSHLALRMSFLQWICKAYGMDLWASTSPVQVVWKYIFLSQLDDHWTVTLNPISQGTFLQSLQFLSFSIICQYLRNTKIKYHTL